MNIKFLSLKIKGFMSLYDEDIDLGNLGVTLVRGINNYDSLFKSNGSGKSAIFDSILWVLTGYTSRGSSNITNMYQVPQTGTYVSVTMMIDNDTYTITRTENYEDSKKSLTIIKNDEDISGNTFSKSKDILKDQLSFINYEVLTSIIILSQGLSGRLSSLKPSDRKSRLEYLSNTDSILEEIQLKVSNAYNDRIANLQSLNSEKSKIESTINANQSTIDSCKRKILEVKALLETQSGIDESTISEYRKRSEELSKTIELMNTKYRELMKLESEHSSKLNSINSELSRISSEIKRVTTEGLSVYSNKCPVCGKPIDNPEEMMKSVNDRLSQLKSRYSELSSEKSVLESKVLPDSSQYYNNIKMYTTEYNGLISKISEYEKSAASTESYDSTMTECQSIINSKNEELVILMSKIKDAEKDVEIANYYKSSVSRKFRNFLLEGVINYLNDRLKYYSQYLFSGGTTVYLENNGNNINIMLDNSYFEDLSGGEGRRVDIILQLAQRDLSRSESGFNCNLLVLDEVLDYLDSDGVYSVLNMLEKESSSIDTMMIVTHKDDISVPCDSELTVIKGKDRLSRISK